MCCNILNDGHAHPASPSPAHAAAGDEQSPAAAASAAACPETAAAELVHALLGDGPETVFGALDRVLRAADPALPPLRELAASPAALAGSRALAPAPPLNDALTRLVRTLLAPRPAIVHSAALRLLDDPRSPWPARAAAVRAVAAAAERELELTAASAAAAARRSPTAAPAPTLREALCYFPYIENYELLVDAEARILAGPLPAPAALSHATPALQTANAELPWWRVAQAGPVAADSDNVTAPAAVPVTTSLAGMTVAFCGSGPLPLTGLLLNIRAGARVVLIDIDADAVAASRQLIDALAFAGIFDRDMFDVCHADAAAVRFIDTRLQSDAKDVWPVGENGQRSGGDVDVNDGANADPIVYCDAVVVASLVPHEIKLALASRLADGGNASPEVLLVRSAVGLVARLAYHRVASEALRRHLAYCGEWVPRRSAGASNTYVPELDGGSLILGTIDADVLNSVEIFRRHK